MGCDPPDFPTKRYIERNAELYGDPALPPGSATCPESYPPSAYAHAQQIEARAQARLLIRPRPARSPDRPFREHAARVLLQPRVNGQAIRVRLGEALSHLDDAKRAYIVGEASLAPSATSVDSFSLFAPIPLAGMAAVAAAAMLAAHWRQGMRAAAADSSSLLCSDGYDEPPRGAYQLQE